MKAFRLVLALLAVGACLSLYSCVKDDFDAPPDMSGHDPNLTVSMDIATLKTKFSGPGSVKIDSDWTISGIVISSDRSGNIYQQLYIADNSGGIMLLLEPSDTYGRYPVGRKIYVKLKGLQYGYYGNFDQIGFGSGMANIPTDMIPNYIIPANIGNPVPTDTFENLAALKTTNKAMLSRLVHIRNVQVVAGDTSKTYATPQVTTNINLEDCNGNKIVLRNSGYADFRGLKLPQGKGSITAIYTTFNSTPQLYIRDVTDIQFNGDRCGGGPGPAAPLVTIDSLKKLYPGTGSVTLTSYRIAGTVISDRSTGNWDGKNIVIQDGSGRGIMVRFSANHNFNKNDSLVIDVSGEPLEQYNNLLQVNGIANAQAVTVATNRTVTPVVLTIAQLLGVDFEMYESTLVKILAATIQSGTYSGNKGLTDATNNTNTLKLYTSASASFAGQTVPSGPKDITGVVGQFGTTKQVQVRSTADVQ